jgi:hypothetical protein
MVSSGDLQAPRKNPGALLKKVLSRTGSRSGYFWDKKNHLPLSGFEARIIQSVALSQYRLLYPGSIINIIAIIKIVVTKSLLLFQLMHTIIHYEHYEPHACTTGWYAAITLTTSIPTSTTKTTLVVLAKHRTASWWWSLREPKHVGANVTVLSVLTFLRFCNSVHQLEQ